MFLKERFFVVEISWNRLWNKYDTSTWISILNYSIYNCNESKIEGAEGKCGIIFKMFFFIRLYQIKKKKKKKNAINLNFPDYLYD